LHNNSLNEGATPCWNSTISPALFEPKSVAVIGASDRENSVGNVIFKNILSSGYKGRLYAINPKHETIQGQQAYKSIEEIGARVEMAVIATRPQTVPQLIEQCGRSGVRNVIVITSGFSEAGHIGAALERKVLEIARSYNVRILGPNCLGIIRPELGLNATFTKITAARATSPSSRSPAPCVRPCSTGPRPTRSVSPRSFRWA
jgi:acetyltransferase